ncbi:hypothetical protein HO133_008571 [Letharia lupina]|uniref:Glutathione S-transferase kappa n=1 Tax=Letharia lupina TaxID=560253 RepID=A0A8H6CNV2_9LECA|nr:uncharacterized protein HO133_008571 [Letharia lupina]KAF6227130.1 hypothetical protein HO133_008571 [Letharia lupina]
MAKPKLVLYVDVVSPFAYLAFHICYTSPVFKGCDVTYVPVFLGGIMKATGNRPPLQIKNKGEWIDKERLRWAKSFNIPMAEGNPPGFPANTIKVQRALTLVGILHPQRLAESLAAVFHASFAEHRQVHTPESLTPIFEKIFGEEGTKEILTKSTSDEVKQLLTAKTNEALAEGSFGLPWYVATNAEGEKECYWGFDHIAQVTDHLGLERPGSDSISGTGWRAML